MGEELWQLGVGELLAGYRARRFSPSEVVASCLARLGEVDPAVHAFVEVREDRARAEADRATRELARDGVTGALFGVPLAVKEIIAVAGSVTSAFTEVSLPWAGRPATVDAAAVAAARAEGAIVLGRTCTHEFAWGITSRHARLGGVVNPWDRTRVAGGSSGGSAAAVATGIVPVALGTDTGGSVRIPASNCGVVGWKLDERPGLLAGVVPLAPSFDAMGVMARSVADALVGLRPLPGTAGWGGGAGALAGRRVGVLRSDALPPLAAEVRAALDQAAGAVQARGAAVEEVAPAWLAEVPEVYMTVLRWEALRVHSDQLGTWPGQADAYGPDVRERMAAAGAVSAEAYRGARQRADTIRAWMARLLDGYACLVSPVWACGPPAIADPDTAVLDGRRVPYRDVVLPFTVPVNVARIHAVSVPVGIGAAGTPLAVQVVGLDAGLIAEAAAAVEASRPAAGWPPLTPPGPA